MDGAVFDDLRARLAHVRPAERIAIGWSLGAQVAIERARVQRDIDRLVLIAATPCFVQREDWAHGVDAGTFRGFVSSLARDIDGTLDRFVSLQARGDTNAKHVMRALRQAKSCDDVGRLEDGLRDLLRTDLRPTLAGLACPALVIHGEHDTLVPRAAAEYLAHELPQAKLEIIGGGAHAPFVSHPERVASAVADFIDG